MKRTFPRLAALAAGLLVATTAMPASADYCYVKIKWNDQAREWQFASDSDWECALCVMGIVPLDDPWAPVEQVEDTLGADLGLAEPSALAPLKYATGIADDHLTAAAEIVRTSLETSGVRYPGSLQPGPGCPPGWWTPDDVD